MKYLFLRLLLMPFGIFYILAVAIRNWLYDRKILKSIEFEVPVISVGNLRVGGSGKSPMVEYLVRLLCTNHKVCILSRGYKRNSSGFRMASSVDTPESLGDESFQFYRKFGSRAGVAVGEDRMMAIPEILALTGEPAVIILDDAFQHRQVKPALNILLTSWQYLFYKDHIMPYGMLREPGKNAARADCVVVTKCPADITSRAMDQTREKLACYAPAKEIFFSTIEYGEPVAF